jgi:hypothetical protein
MMTPAPVVIPHPTGSARPEAGTTHHGSSADSALAAHNGSSDVCPCGRRYDDGSHLITQANRELARAFPKAKRGKG